MKFWKDDEKSPSQRMSHENPPAHILGGYVSGDKRPFDWKWHLIVTEDPSPRIGGSCSQFSPWSWWVQSVARFKIPLKNSSRIWFWPMFTKISNIFHSKEFHSNAAFCLLCHEYIFELEFPLEQKFWWTVVEKLPWGIFKSGYVCAQLWGESRDSL